MPASALQSSLKRQVLKAILFALPEAMNRTASQAATRFVSQLFKYHATDTFSGVRLQPDAPTWRKQ